MFDHLGPEHVELMRQVRTRDLHDPGQHVLHLRYRVKKGRTALIDVWLCQR